MYNPNPTLNFSLQLVDLLQFNPRREKGDERNRAVAAAVDPSDGTEVEVVVAVARGPALTVMTKNDEDQTGIKFQC